MSLIDVGGKIRPGEELDILAVEQWLKTQGVDLQGEAIVTQYSGGKSNWTYRLRYENIDLVLRRPPKGHKINRAHDVVREFQIQKNLADFYPVVPEMIAVCQDHSVIGCDFYIMKRIKGIILRSKLPPELNFSEKQVHQLCVNMLDKLIQLHQVPYQGTALENFGDGQNYCRNQLEAWDRRYTKARTLNVPSFRFVRKWLFENLPQQSTTCLIHNDWRFDNLILDPQQPTEIIGVLDWEMATLGDPLMELGTALAYWVEPTDNMIFKSTRRQPTHMAGMFTRKQVVEYYLEKTGLSAENWTFYEVFGLFRLAVVTQQIYYRYFHKHSVNPAVKNFWMVVQALHVRALKLIAQHKLKDHELAQRYKQKLQGILKP